MGRGAQPGGGELVSAPRAVVVGGGLAGLSAALTLVDGGAEVVLLEARPRLGGATWSFQRNGLSFDNGQHVHMRCCTAYRRFLRRIGSAQDAPLRGRLEIPVLRPVPGAEPAVAWLRRDSLPAPLQLGRALTRYRHLRPADRARLGGAVLALLRLELTDASLDSETFGSFLARHGQRAAAVEALWDLIALPTLNLRAGEASLALAAKVFKTGLLTEPDAADLGWARVPLGRLHGDAAASALRLAGATVRRRSKVEAIPVGAGTGSERAVQGVFVGGELLAADAVVLAVPHEAAADLLPAGASVDPGVVAGLGRSPIIDVHVVYDRKVFDYPMAAALGSPVQYVFDTTESSGMPPEEGQCVAVSVSGADAEHGEAPARLVERYVAALAELFPRARTARVVDAVVTREHSATFRATPGTARLRPRPDSGIPGLYLAGAWTDTGWPATMEGAVRSGIAAGAMALRRFSRARGLLGGLADPGEDLSEEGVA